MRLFDITVDALEKNMDLRLQRQAYINANIANADTPGYLPVDLKFEDELMSFLGQNEDKMDTTNNKHMGGRIDVSEVQGELIEQAGEMSPDGNAVDLDRQMAELGNNSFNYRMSAKVVNKQLALLKYVITQTR